MAPELAVPDVAVVDYGMGNLRSVEKALERSGARASITRDADEIRAADGAVLPGVGAFPEAMRNLRDLGLDALVAERITSAVPTLGICLGMQVLFETSSELGGAWGLGLLGGRVDQLDAMGQKVPHIGWNPVRWHKRSDLVEGLPDECPFYFVHSYAPVPTDDGDVLGTAEYGERFVCGVERAPLYGVQFHPEKSSAAGLRMLANFCAICSRATSNVNAA